MAKTPLDFVPFSVAVLTVSDDRTVASDDTGDLLAGRVIAAGHNVAAREIAPHNLYRLRSVLSCWIADSGIQAVLVNGGTGLYEHNCTPEAVAPLLDKPLVGFGELFRFLSYQDVGTSTIASRAIAGTANGTLIFCLPGSPRACEMAWDKIIQAQLGNRHMTI